jgi:ferric-dicitrate binding protein FerR (iron transport regulator)
VKDYVHFTVNDFVMDEFFRAWVKSPDPETNLFWRSWLAAHPQKVAVIEEARYILQHLVIPEYKITEEEVVHLWKRIRGINRPPSAPPETSLRKLSPWWSWVAAATVLVGVAFYFLVARENLIEYKTAYGETRSIILPDRSEVVLNANSKLSFKDNWDSAPRRELHLEGEAYFSVTHQESNQPFLVMTGDGVSVEVLGTTFNVYHRTQETRVLLNSGRISLSLPTDNAEEKIIMQPGELVEFTSNQYHRKSVDPQRYVAWTEHKLILDHTSLRDMVKMLKENYGIDVEVVPSALLDQTVSGSMPAAGEEELISQIARAFRLKATREGNRVLMKE